MTSFAMCMRYSFGRPKLEAIAPCRHQASHRADICLDGMVRAAPSKGRRYRQILLGSRRSIRARTFLRLSGEALEGINPRPAPASLVFAVLVEPRRQRPFRPE
jgi:hypothetical protein